MALIVERIVCLAVGDLGRSAGTCCSQPKLSRGASEVAEPFVGGESESGFAGLALVIKGVMFGAVADLGRSAVPGQCGPQFACFAPELAFLRTCQFES